MTGKLPPLPALQAFEAAARYENFAAAAEELNLSQSAVSHRVRNLEHYLGFKLFERLPRGLRLTEAGKAYLPSIRNAFEDIVSATSGVFGNRKRSSLNIRAPVSYVALWLTQIIDRFRSEYPHIEIHLTSSIWAERTATGESDVEFRIGDGNWFDYTSEFLFRDPLIAVASSENPMIVNRLATPSELAGCSLVHVLGAEDHWSKYFAQAGVTRQNENSDIRVDFSISAAEQTACSERIALLQERLAQRYLDTGRLRVVSKDKLMPKEAIYLVRPVSTDPRKPEATLFENWIKSEITAQGDTF